MTSIFKPYPAKQNIEKGQTMYADVINHCLAYKEYIDPSSKITSAHEVTHRCNSDIRNEAGGNVNGFYVGNDRAIVIPEPNTKKSDCAQYIPESLRGGRYSLYITGQQEWNNQPLYIFDEFVAYTNDVWAAIMLKRLENYVEQGVIIDGPVEFISYATATMMAADRAGSLNQPLIDFGRWMLRHAYNSYFESLKDFPPYDVQDKIYNIHKSGNEWQMHRTFLKQRLNYEVPSGIEPENDDPNPPTPPDTPINWYI